MVWRPLDRKNLLFIIGIGIVLCILPTFVKSGFIVHIFIMTFILSAVVAAWDLIVGYAGIFSFGQVAFFTIGAYGSAITSMQLGITPWVAILLGGISAGIVGLIIGIPCLNLKGLYVALVTFALHLSLTAFIYLGKPIGTGGSHSLTGIPSLKIGSYVFTIMNRVPFYYVALALSSVVIFIVYKIIHSSFGMAFTALRDSENFSKSIGINAYRYKIIVFGISSLLAGIMGGFYSHYVGLISHNLVGLDLIILLLVALIIGGLGKFPGSIVATYIIVFLNEYLRPLEEYRAIILGAIVIAAIILLPGGIGDGIRIIANKVTRKIALKQ